MARRIRLVSGACCPPAAQHDSECKLQLMHVSELLAKCGPTCHRRGILVGAPHRDNTTYVHFLTLCLGERSSFPHTVISTLRNS